MALERSHTLAELLRGYRRGANLTQEELAERAGLSVRAVRNLESGDSRTPRRETLILLADALALSGPAREAFLAAARQTTPLTSTTRITDPPRADPTGPHPGVPLVGRSRELARLARLLKPDDADATMALMLEGEPGIGKSRLLQEAELLAREAGWAVLASGCHRRSGQEPYAPFPGLLARFLSARPLTERRRDLAGCGWLVHLLPELLDSAVVPAPAWQLPPEQERRLMFGAVRRFLHNVAGRAGMLLVLDDLQWAGADALDLLASLLREPPPLDHPETPLPPVRVLAAYRASDLAPGDALPLLLADLVREGTLEQLALGPLTHGEQEILLGCLLASTTGVSPQGASGADDGGHSSSGGPFAMSDEQRGQVLGRADGVPYFLLSFVQSLRSAAADPSRRGAVPTGIRQSIRQRLLSLPPEARELLGIVAVAGRQIPRRRLLQVNSHLGRDIEMLLAALEAACQGALLTDAISGEIGFTHELIREVVLEDLTLSRRAAWHLALADVIERLPEGERERNVAELAAHLAEAGEHARALPYTLRAGDRAEALYAHAQAEEYYRSSLELVRSLDDRSREAEAEEKLGMVLAVVARYREALEMLEAARARYAALGQIDAQARVVAQLGVVHSSLGTPSEGIELLQREVSLLVANGASEVRLAEVEFSLCELFRDSGRYDEHLHAAERAAALARATSDARLRARAEARLGRSLLIVERNREGMAILERTLPELEAVGDLRNLAFALNALAVAHETQEGDFALARSYLTRAVTCAERLGDPTLLAFMVSRRGTNAFATGDWQSARGDLEHAVTLTKEADGTWAATYPLINLARLYLATGQRQRAWVYLAPALEVAERSGDIQALRAAYVALAESEILGGRADRARERLERLLARVSADDQIFAALPLLALAVLVASGDTTYAASLLARSLAQAKRSQNRAVMANALRVNGLLLSRENRHAEACAALEESLVHARATSDPYGTAKSLFACGQVHEASGEREQARECYESALAICERLGEALYRPSIERALAAVTPARVEAQTELQTETRTQPGADAE